MSSPLFIDTTITPRHVETGSPDSQGGDFFHTIITPRHVETGSPDRRQGDFIDTTITPRHYGTDTDAPTTSALERIASIVSHLFTKLFKTLLCCK
jgi:hypothetical protein